MIASGSVRYVDGWWDREAYGVVGVCCGSGELWERLDKYVEYWIGSLCSN